VAFGCPKAEKWMAMHYRDLGVPVVAGIGATIDFLAGRVKRAPRWMQRAGMEWIFRLACEPRRLFWRYMKDLWVFGWRIVAQLSLLQWLPRISRWTSKLSPRRWWEATRCVGRHCMVDLSGIRFMDSTDVGLLLTLQKKLHAAGRQFVLASVSRGVQRELALMHVKDHFDIAQDVAAAERIIAERTLEESAMVTPRATDGAPGLAWQGEITAINAGEVWNHTRDLLEREGKPSSVAIDLSRARFIDSSGLTTMLRLQKWAWRQGTKIVFTGLQPAARDVVRRMAKLDQLLLEKPELYGLIAESIS